MRSTPSLRRFPGSAFETEFLRWAGLNNNDPTSRPFKADRCRLSLRFPPSGDRWCNVYDLVPAASVPSFSTGFIRRIYQSYTIPGLLVVNAASLRVVVSNLINCVCECVD